MCGIFGVVTSTSHRPCLTREHLLRARDRMTYRGPDDAGLWDGGHCILAHRRLKVVDLSEHGAQPMIAPGGRDAIVYNGELYNDAELRRELTPQLASRAQAFRGSCDTETLLAALSIWGEAALPRLRGMFAFGHLSEGRLLLARDPLGIKPLYWRRWHANGIAHLAFASTIAALLDLPGANDAPDLVTLSAYLTTIRTTLGARTLYQGIQCLEPGTCLSLDLRDDKLTPRLTQWSRPDGTHDPADPAETRAIVMDSVVRHLRSDVPLCSLLSGGLDSSILAYVARPHLAELHTYCSGARISGSADDDFTFARRAADALGTSHTEAPVTRACFELRWPEMVETLATPLSTPNEVAINQVARTLRADGRIVTLSGEGADELFAGYNLPLSAMARYIAQGGGDPASHALAEASWIPPDAKAAVLDPEVWRSVEHDAALAAWYHETWSELAAQTPAADPHAHALQTLLRLTRRVNLEGLLARLDTSTMLAGVEGRTPLADQVVAAFAEALPLGDKFDPHQPAPHGTKISLRHAFAPDLPREIIDRPKSSFPLPVQEWMDVGAGWLRGSAFAREVFTPAAIETVAARPNELWRLSWPMINLALWGRRWE
ncbi:MAG: asparagine synthase (glutamine-hydrolyzing) [Tepidisphaera sp.]|nr:asparagine synthase (glutamine-hydrolyzing) [Tepidisphaera sp.]